MLTLKIDVTKIDKAALYKGTKGTYLSLALIPTPRSPYGDYMVVQDLGKEKRLAGIKGPILGNASEASSFRKKQQPPAYNASPPEMPEDKDNTPDVPF